MGRNIFSQYSGDILATMQAKKNAIKTSNRMTQFHSSSGSIAAGNKATRFNPNTIKALTGKPLYCEDLCPVVDEKPVANPCKFTPISHSYTVKEISIDEGLRYDWVQSNDISISFVSKYNNNQNKGIIPAMSTLESPEIGYVVKSVKASVYTVYSYGDSSVALRVFAEVDSFYESVQRPADLYGNSLYPSHRRVVEPIAQVASDAANPRIFYEGYGNLIYKCSPTSKIDLETSYDGNCQIIYTVDQLSFWKMVSDDDEVLHAKYPFFHGDDSKSGDTSTLVDGYHSIDSILKRDGIFYLVSYIVISNDEDTAHDSRLVLWALDPDTFEMRHIYNINGGTYISRNYSYGIGVDQTNRLTWQVWEDGNEEVTYRIEDNCEVVQYNIAYHLNNSWPPEIPSRMQCRHYMNTVLHKYMESIVDVNSGFRRYYLIEIGADFSVVNSTHLFDMYNNPGIGNSALCEPHHMAFPPDMSHGKLRYMILQDEDGEVRAYAEVDLESIAVAIYQDEDLVDSTGLTSLSSYISFTVPHSIQTYDLRFNMPLYGF